jgi:uracil-DNA glycosylase
VLDRPGYARLQAWLAGERARATVYPPEEQVWTALQRCAYEDVRVVILGQDPYHGPGQAHGLSFSVPPGVKPPPSLKNIYKELQADLGIKPPAHGNLSAWAERGVLLLNAVLTVRASEAGSHQGQGWEAVTEAILAALVARPEPIIFVLWGKPAQKKAGLIRPPHRRIEAAHPSPLSAHNGFFGSRPFSSIHSIQAEWGQAPIDFSLGS